MNRLQRDFTAVKGYELKKMIMKKSAGRVRDPFKLLCFNLIKVKLARAMDC